MRGSVERSQSLRLQGTESPTTSLRPKVSFNRAVHIKRISRKDRLVEEEEGEEGESTRQNGKMAANGLKTSSKFSTLPSRSGQRNGLPGGAPSDRLSRLIRTDPKPEENQANLDKKPPIKRKTLGERVRGIFTKRKSEEKQDELKARYTEFKGRNSSSDATDNEIEQYQGKRRGSAPETRTSWFRSLERLKKPETGRKERYFGESDRDSGSQRRSRAYNESSAESATEQEGMGSRAPSLVYLHTAAVGDIPQRRSETPSRRLSRSVSVLAPWAPKSTRPPRSNTSASKSGENKKKNWPPKAVRSRATQTESPQQLLHVPAVESRSLPKLVFTGPSIDETISGRSTTSSIQRSTVHLRSRK